MSLLPSSYDSSSAADGEPRVVGVESEEADEIFAALSAGTARQLLAELHDDPAPPSELANRVDTSVQNAQYHLEKLETAGAIEVVDTAYSEKGREMSIYAPAHQPLVIFAGEEDEQSALRTALSRFLGSVGLLALASAVVQAVFGERLLPFGDTGPTGSSEDAGDGDAGSDDAGGGATGGDAADGGTDERDAGGTDGGAGDDTDDTDAPTEETEERPDADETVDSEQMDSPDGDGVDTVADNESVDTVADGVDMTDPESASTAAETAANLPPGVLFFAGGLFIICVVALYFHYQ